MTKKLQTKEYGISTLKGIIGAIPFAGTFLNEVAFEARSRIKQERVNHFIEEFSEYMNEHTNGEDNFDTLNTEQIGDIFEEIGALTFTRSKVEEHIENAQANLTTLEAMGDTKNLQSFLRLVLNRKA